MSVAREERQQTIRMLVRSRTIRTQNELAEELRAHGCNVTQATISRDIADLRLQKNANGVYVLSEDLRLHAIASTAIRHTARAGNQVVIHTEPGSAPSVAAAIDAAGPEGVIGSIAGDDTVLVIAQDDESGASFQSSIDSLIG